MSGLVLIHLLNLLYSKKVCYIYLLINILIFKRQFYQIDREYFLEFVWDGILFYRVILEKYILTGGTVSFCVSVSFMLFLIMFIQTNFTINGWIWK